MEQLTNYKVVIVGKSFVGKSSLLLRFTDDLFTTNYQPTIGVDFKFRKMQLGDDMIRIQVWDTAGQEKYQSITKTFYKNTHCVIVVFDLCDRSTFDEIEEIWMKEIHKNCNKSDLADRQIAYEEGKAFADKFKMLYYETSAKEGTNVEIAFLDLIKQVHAKKIENNEKENIGGQIYETKQRQNPCCSNQQKINYFIKKKNSFRFRYLLYQ